MMMACEIIIIFNFYDNFLFIPQSQPSFNVPPSHNTKYIRGSLG
jgi:hypothetical protein